MTYNQITNFIDAIKENIKDLDSIDSKNILIQNYNLFINYMIGNEGIQFFLSENKRYNVVLNLILFYQEILNKEEHIEIFINLINTYLNTIDCTRYHLSNLIFRYLFDLLINYNRNELGLEIFTSLSNHYEINLFNNSKAYAIYFSYQLKTYDRVEKILDNFFIEFKSNDYSEAKDFSLINFYKGLIFLSKKEFVKASMSFMSCMKVIPSNNVLTYFHIESLKRLILLGPLLDSNYTNQIFSLTNHFKRWYTIKPTESYGDIHKILSNKNSSIKDLEKFINEHQSKFKADKIYGLVKLCKDEFIINKIINVLISYTRIRLEKLGSLIDVTDKNVLVSSLKLIVAKNKLSLKFDEIDEIIEVVDSETRDLEELKQTFIDVNSVQNELIKIYFRNSEVNEKAKQNQEKQMMRAMLLESVGGETYENNLNNYFPNQNSNFTNTPAESKSRGGMNPHQ